MLTRWCLARRFSILAKQFSLQRCKSAQILWISKNAATWVLSIYFQNRERYESREWDNKGYLMILITASHPQVMKYKHISVFTSQPASAQKKRPQHAQTPRYSQWINDTHRPEVGTQTDLVSTMSSADIHQNKNSSMNCSTSFRWKMLAKKRKY